jgi:hypothetical protein
MFHKISDGLDVRSGASSGPGILAKSQTVVQYGGGVDLTKYKGGFCFNINAGTFGSSATLDAKLQDSADDSSYADLSTAIAITQMTAAGEANLEARVRRIPRRYVRVAVTAATAAVVFGVTFIGQKKTI